MTALFQTSELDRLRITSADAVKEKEAIQITLASTSQVGGHHCSDLCFELCN